MVTKKISVLIVLISICKLCFAQSPNDPEYVNQYYISSSGVNSIWSQSLGLSSSPIAIIGVGGGKYHNDLNSRVTDRTVRITNNNFRGGFNPINGIVGAETNNSLGIAGINWNSPIYNYDVGKIKVGDDKMVNRYGQSVPGQEVVKIAPNAVVNDIYTSIADGAGVIYMPMSWLPETKNYNLDPLKFQVYPDFRITDTKEYFFSNLRRILDSVNKDSYKYTEAIIAVKNAYLNDRVVVAAQNSYDGEFIGFPANLSDDRLVITVGSTSFDGASGYTYSSSIPNDEDEVVDLVTYGVDLLTTAPDNSGYIEYTGTAGAGAIATGIISLLQGIDSSLEPEDIKEVLRRTAQKIGNPNLEYDKKRGFGRIDGTAAKEFINNYTFERGILNNTSSIVKIKNDVKRLLYNGAWGDIASAYYLVDIHKLTYELPISPFNNVEAWFRAKDTKGWSVSDPNYQRRYADVEIVDDDKIVFSTYIWFIESQYPGSNLNVWRPIHPDNSQVSYTIATKPRSQNTERIFVKNEIISNSRYYQGSKIFIAPNVTVTIESDVDMTGMEVLLGENARIEVRNGGKLIANDTDFKNLDPNHDSLSKFNGIRLYTDGNSFTNCSFSGGWYGLYSNNADGHTIINSSFTNNRYGLYFNGSDGIDLEGVVSTNNSYDGLRLYNSEATTSTYIPSSNAWPVHTTFSNNGSNGIDMDSYAKLWMYETVLENNSSHDITLGTNSRAYTGSSYYSTSSGHNKFGNASSSGRYIYSLAMTGTSENQTQWTVPARYNYWEDGTAPSSSEFYGSVSYSSHLTEDPTFYDPHPNPDMTDEEETPEIVLSANVANKAVKSANSKLEEQKILQIKQRLLELEGLMQENETTLLNGRWLKTYAGFLKYLDKSLLSHERSQVRGWQNQWLGRFHAINTPLTADSLADEEQAGLVWQAEVRGNSTKNPEMKRGSAASLKAAQIVGETAVILEVEEALEKDLSNRVIKLYEKYGPYVANKDNQLELLSGLSLAYQKKSEYGKALAVIYEMENIKPDEDMTEHWEALDFYEVKKMLSDSAVAHHQDIVFEKAAPSSKTKEVSSIPEEFELLNAYPNPFNPTAVIPFSLPKDGKVRVEVYNVAGKLVSILVNSNYPAGVHQIQFDGEALSSGVYIIKAVYNGTSLTQKVTLIK